MDSEKESILAQLLFRIETVQKSQNNKYVVLNAHKDHIDAIKKLLPGIKSPSIMPLAEEGWFSLHSVISETQFWENIDALKKAGAEGILVMSIEKMIN